MSILLDTNVKKNKEKQTEKLVDKFQYILNNYVNSKKLVNKDDEIYKCIVNAIPQQLDAILGHNQDYDIRGSIGKGTKTSTPWIALLNRKCASEINKGIYICYIFKEDMSGFYLTLMQGIVFYEKFKNKKNEYCQIVTNYFKNELKGETKFSIDNIHLTSLNNKGSRQYKYSIATILSKFYKTNSFNTQTLLDDLNNMINVYEFVIKHFDVGNYEEVIRRILDRILNVDNMLSADKALQEINKKIEDIDGSAFRVNTLKEEEPLKGKSKKFKAITSSPIKKTDWINKAKLDALNGLKGEALCLEYEQNKLKRLGRSDLCEQIKQVSIKSDDYGYDIESFEIDPKTNKEHKIYIEVKTTQNKTDTDFYISKNEIEQAKKFQNKYCLFRIYDLYGDTPKFYRRFGEIEENFFVDPISYIARIKN